MAHNYLELSSLSHEERTVLQSKCVGGTKYYSDRKWFNPVYEKLVEILGNGNKSHEKSVRWFLSCTAKALRNKGSGFFFGKHPSWFKDTDQGIGYTNSVKILDELCSKGYIDIWLGYVETWTQCENSSGYMAQTTHPSIVVMKQKYLDLWKGIDMEEMPALKKESSVIIRDRQTKEEITLQGHPGVKEARATVDRLNKKLSETEIRIKDELCASVTYSRIFSDDLESDGRFYVNGGGVQTAPAFLRKTSLYIGDDKTVELDFKAMHPSLLLEMMRISALQEGREFCVGKDFSPYDVYIDDLIEIDQEAIEKQSELLGSGYNPIRNLKKQCLLVMINANSFVAARSAVSGKIKRDKDRPDPVDRLFTGIVGSVPVSEVLRRIEEHNQVISKYMYSDVGIALMNMDSRIAERVIDAILQEDEAVLCYHDSFIVKHYMAEFLEKAMRKAWKDVMLNDYYCKIERK